MAAYLDTSALVSIFLTDTHTPAMDRWIQENMHDLCISQLGAVEFASAISIRLRRQDVTQTLAARYLASFDYWQRETTHVIQVIPADFEHSQHFVRRFDLKLRGPDALHIATCARQQAQLITFDRTQAAAARALGLTVEIPA